MHLVCQGKAHCRTIFWPQSDLKYTRRPILSLVGNWNGYCDPAAQRDVLRIMINEGQYDPMEEANRTTVMHSFHGSPTCYRWLLEQEEFLIDFEQRAFNIVTIDAALMFSQNSNSSSCLEAAIAHQSNSRYPGRLDSSVDHHPLLYWAIMSLHYTAADVHYPKCVKVLWNAGVDFHPLRLHDSFRTTLEFLFFVVDFYRSDGDYTEINYQRCEIEQTSVPSPPLRSTTDAIEYDRLEDTSAIEHRPRTSRLLWHTWYAGNDLSILEVAQRWLDAWIEILLEAGLDIAEYGRREDELHPEGLLVGRYGEARVYFEYGEHVRGCRIHVTEIWLCNRTRKRPTSAKASKMPGSWDFDDA